MTSAIKDFRVLINVRNNQLYERREALGFTMQQMANNIGINYNSYQRYETLRDQPTRKNGQLKMTARKIANYFGEFPEVLWSEEIKGIKTSTLIKKFSGEQARSLVSAYTERTALPPDKALEDQEFRARLRSILHRRLTSQEAALLSLRFGLTGKPPEDAHVVSQTMSLSVDVVRVMERRALDKLRAAPVMAELLQVVNLPMGAAMLKYLKGLAGFLGNSRTSNSSKPWTQEEDAIIRDKSLSSRAAQHRLNRTLMAVRSRRTSLGVRTGYIYPPGERKG